MGLLVGSTFKYIYTTGWWITGFFLNGSMMSCSNKNDTFCWISEESVA